MLSLFKKKPKSHRNITPEQRLRLEMEGLNALDEIPFAGFWVKRVSDKELGSYVFCYISATITKMLHDADNKDCVGKSDYCVACEHGCRMTEEQFASVCHASDEITVNGERGKPYVFIEFIKGAFGDNDLHIWKTTKCVVQMKDALYIYGHAEILDRTHGSYQAALNYVKSKKDDLQKINENLYVVK